MENITVASTIVDIDGSEISRRQRDFDGAKISKKRKVSDNQNYLEASQDDTIVQDKQSELNSGETGLSISHIKKLILSGTYVPPAKLAAYQESITDESSLEYQKIYWHKLRKGINGLINKINVANIKDVIPEIFELNLVRGSGLFCKSVLRAQVAATLFTPVYACMVAVINTKLPQVGQLVSSRLISLFKKSYRRNDKKSCLSSSIFIAHLVNFQVLHEIIVLQILSLLVNKSSDSSIEIATVLLRENGQLLTENSPKAQIAIFERLRQLLVEGSLSLRTQFMIEVLFQVRKDKYVKNPIIPSELDLIEEEDQVTHFISLDEELDIRESLDIFHFDENFIANESEYKSIRDEILGTEEDDESDLDSQVSDHESSPPTQIQDETEMNSVNLRKTIYLTIMSSVSIEECCHKLLKLKISEAKHLELCKMIVESCMQEKSYIKFYGLIGERFCNLKNSLRFAFQTCFREYYQNIHRYEVAKIRNIARFFGFLFLTSSIPFEELEIVDLSEESTTSSSRIFLKILFQDIAETIGLPSLINMVETKFSEQILEALFPSRNATVLRFSINFFTSIGLGALTEQAREKLKNLGK